MQATGTPAGRATRKGLVIGRVGTAPVMVDSGLLLLAALLAFVAGPIASHALPTLGVAGGYLVGLGFAVLLLGSILLHELAHAWVARRRGVQVRQIVLTLVGGHTEMAQAGTAATSALIAVAGPLTNLAVAAVAWLAWQNVPGGGVPALLLVMVASSNALVTALNLLPGLPMDGGWILEALVWRVTGRRWTGTIAAAWCGRVVAVGLPVVAIGVPMASGASPSLFSVIWAAAVGAMFWTSAGASIAGAGVRRRVEVFSIRSVARPAVAAPVRAVLADLPADGEVVVLGDRGDVVGYVDRVATAAVPAEARGTTPVGAVLVPLPAGSVIDGRLTGQDAVRAVQLAARMSPVLAVLGPDGVVTGLLRYLDVARVLAGTPRLGHRDHPRDP